MMHLGFGSTIWRVPLLALLFGCCLSLSSLQATHIVGGELNYTCLGNNNYEITLTIYRDCFYGNPAAYFDDPASVGVFNANNQLLQQILIPLMEDDTLSPVLNNECLVIPPDVCVHTTTYRAIVNLPPVIGGYQLAYQRCCRNQTIANIVDPLATGATYSVNITERALLECNSSPQFNTWPPLYICANQPLVVDQSAFDADGDSIVYRLCAPLEGATPAVPRPQPPNAPPYDPVVWVAPPYGILNMLNGTPGGTPLQINSQTGLLTAVPNTVGQFVVGICVEEYRDGELISTTRRDFQYNVGICGITTAAFFAPEIQCDDLSVTFSNESVGTTAFRWEFNDPANPGASSSLPNPVYTYADTGRYIVRLIAAPGSICSDTFEREVYLQYNSLFPAFDGEILSCGDSLVLAMQDLTTDTISQPVGWSWQVSGGQVSTETNPVFTFYESGQVQIRLTVEAANGCTQTVERLFQVKLIEESLGPDSVYICPGDSIRLNEQFDPAYNYTWLPDTGLSNATVANPWAQPTETTTYTARIQNAAGTCEVERQITVVVPPLLSVAAPPDILTCEPSVTLTASTNNEIQSILWSTSPTFNSILATTASVQVSLIGEDTYYVLVRDLAGCIATDSVHVLSQAVNIFGLSNPPTCLGNFVAIGVGNQDPTDVLTYDWSPDSLVVLLGTTASPVVRPIQAGPQPFVVTATNQYGCMAMDTIIVFAIDTTDALTASSVVQCSGYQVFFNTSSTDGLLYTWHFGDPSQPNASASGASVSHTYPGPGVYEVWASLPFLQACADTLRLSVTVEEPAIIPGFDWSLESCSDTAVVSFVQTSVNTQSDIIGVLWDFGNGQTSAENAPSLSIGGSVNLLVQLTLFSSDGCIDSISRPVSVVLPELELPDTLRACAGQGIYLNPDADASLIYSWTPTTGLDNPSSPNPLANPNVLTTYQVTVGVPNSNCEIVRELTVIPVAAPQLSLPADTTYCGGSLLLFADSDQPGEVSWALDDSFNELIANTPELMVTPTGNTTYFVRLSVENGCEVIDSVSVNFSGIQISLDPPTTLCVGDTLLIRATNLGDDPLTYIWSPESAIVAGNGTNEVLVSPAVTGPINLLVSNGFGCVLDTSVQVSIFNYVPPLTVVPSIDTIFSGESVQLTATESTGYTYLWGPAGGLSANQIFNPVASPEQTTLYELVVRDANGCINRAQALIVVLNAICREPYVFVPNAFTPNGDNLNDAFNVEGSQVEEMYLAVYDRWGELVFESQDRSRGWDGSFRGKALAPDVYGYYIKLRCIGGEEYIKTGNVTLLR